MSGTATPHGKPSRAFAPPSAGAGASRGRAVAERHPVLDGMRIALGGALTEERSWEKGPRAEAAIARSLERHCGEQVLFLHGRRLPQSRVSVDHLAIAPSGVWVIDAKDYRGKLAIRGRLLGEPRLIINGRDRSGLVDGLDRRLAVVGELVHRLDPTVALHGALCFLSTELPMFRSTTFRGHPLSYPRPLAKRLTAPGPIRRAGAERLREELEWALPPA